MPRNEKRRQAALQRHASKRKEKKQALGYGSPGSHRALVRLAAHWPLHECLVSRDWQREGEIIQTVVARRSPQGEIVAGSFLVDLCCLGVKDAFATRFGSVAEYEDRLRQPTMERQPMVGAELDLIARIVREAIAYARSLGFSPHRDYHDAAPLLEGANPDACNLHVPLGKDGMPFFVAGPYDNVGRIMAQLERKVGAGNFHFLTPLALDDDELLFGLDEDELLHDLDDDPPGPLWLPGR
jgi:hypothetical protein